MRDIEELFGALSRSKFRSRFKLGSKEAAYLQQKGLAVILEHAGGFIKTRLSITNSDRDGRQTPMKNHPVFIAQHATAACCRKCLEKWHFIPKNRPLTEEEIEYIVLIIRRWLVSKGTG